MEMDISDHTPADDTEAAKMPEGGSQASSEPLLTIADLALLDDIAYDQNRVAVAKEMGVHIEITTLLIQKLNSKSELVKKVAEMIFNELGDSVPYHISRFFPHYESNKHGLKEPTPLKSLYNAHDIAKDIGLKYVYLGNLSNNDFNNTICPKCSKLVIKRNQLTIQELNLDITGNCKYCGFHICVV